MRFAFIFISFLVSIGVTSLIVVFLIKLVKKIKFKKLISKFESGDLIRVKSINWDDVILIKWDNKNFVWKQQNGSDINYDDWSEFVVNKSYKMRLLDDFMKNNKKEIISLNRKDKLNKLDQSI